MKVEIENERKFLVRAAPLKTLVNGVGIAQGYFSAHWPAIVRVRIENNKRGFLTVKIKTAPDRKIEMESRIDIQTARELLNHTTLCLRKTRYKIGRLEIDVFHEELEGLVLAELELESVEQMKEEVSFPPGFVVQEVTGSDWFDNHELARRRRVDAGWLYEMVKFCWGCKDVSGSV
ncbi:MAG: adenylate cyclase [Parcubacteria group bacterium CG11_big_fil_rev_8_21_14_0_20_39_14]|nr:MAG: adenylate cyclase [Parcubacteria group bacterium CG11_big_fil_rev_8_21_14_0_20_39_14]PIS35581.1 MAG: adenylate cyclase [Parcubacteria group bacterium CG08_land_8_20_14_0_20_38_56]